MGKAKVGRTSSRILTAVALTAGLAFTGLTSTASATSAATAAGCRNIYTSVTGAYFQGTVCYDPDMWWMSPEYDELPTYLEDTAKDGRRAELWVGYTSSGSDRELVLEATCGVGCAPDAGGLWAWATYPYTGDQARFRVCTSDAGASRRCGSWN